MVIDDHELLGAAINYIPYDMNTVYSKIGADQWMIYYARNGSQETATNEYIQEVLTGSLEAGMFSVMNVEIDDLNLSADDHPVGTWMRVYIGGARAMEMLVGSIAEMNGTIRSFESRFAALESTTL